MNKVFLIENFNGIINDLPLTRGIPVIFTSYTTQGGVSPRTLFDYNQGYPGELIKIRNKAEDILVISRFVSGTRTPDSEVDTVEPIIN